MTVETSWQIIPADGFPMEGISYYDLVKFLKTEGVLVPDTRLQAIADAPRCEHGKIDRHYDLPEGQWLDEGVWCEGAPELRALLGALAEE